MQTNPAEDWRSGSQGAATHRPRFPARRAVHLARLLTLPICSAVLGTGNVRAAEDYRQDVTFIVVADPQVPTKDEGTLSTNEYRLRADSLVGSINSITNRQWPWSVSQAGKPIDTPSGVVVLGDLTQHASIYKYSGWGALYTAPEFELFRRNFEFPPGPDLVFGPDYYSVGFPVYVGLGNHDFLPTRSTIIDGLARLSILEYVKERHCGISSFVPTASYDPASHAYSWDWGMLHCVQLHRYGGDTGEADWYLGKPGSSLPWLATDLEANAHRYAEIVRPVVLFQHFAWRDSTNRYPLTNTRVASWQCSLDEVNALNDVVRSYNVIAAFHGHYHRDVVECYTEPYLGNKRFNREVAIFDVPKAPRSYCVVRVGDDGLQVGGMTADWAKRTWSMAATHEKTSKEGTYALYNPAPPVLREFSTSANWTTAMARHLADVNGDGRDDLVGFKQDGVWVAYAKEAQNPSDPLPVFEAARHVLNAFQTAGGWGHPNYPVFLGDVNNDGRADIVRFGKASVRVATAKRPDQFTKESPFQMRVGDYPDFTEKMGWDARHLRTLADVNGDGRDDLVGFGYDGTDVAFARNQDGGGIPFEGPIRALELHFGYDAPAGWRREYHPRLLADVDGDGCADIVGFSETGVEVSFSKGELQKGFQPPVSSIREYGIASGGWEVNKHPRELADVNGDGWADIVAFGNLGVSVALATGNRNAPFEDRGLVLGTFGYEAGGWRVAEHPRFVTDINGDGCADIIGFGGAGVVVATAEGKGAPASNPLFNVPAQVINAYGSISEGWQVGKHPRALADVNHDGVKEIVGFGDFGVLVTRLEECKNDTDGDGIPDGWEIRYGLKPAVPGDEQGDLDHDGLNALLEYQKNTNPLKADTDDDGLPDPWEVAMGLDAARYNPGGDPDGDGLSNTAEYQCGTAPRDANSVLKFDAVNRASNGTAVVLSWRSVAGRRYSILYTDAIRSGVWIVLCLNVQATGSLTSLTDTSPPLRGCRFYQLQLER